MATFQTPELSDIRTTLAGKSFFVTGALGFIGKAFVEKVLRSVPDCGKIFVLIRSKTHRGKHMTAQDRLEKVMEESLFNRLREENPDVLSKVVGVEGDITLDNLGLSETDLETVISTVTVVVHCAATVRFDEALKDAVQINLKGTMNTVFLARKLQKCDVCVQVSTLYSQCQRPETEEIYYATEYPPQRFLDTSEWMDGDIQDIITPKLLNGRPNTYILTKSLAEYWLSQEATDLPLVLFRPSIITAACEEPEPGWCDNLNGAHGLVFGVGKGLIRSIKLHAEKVIDCVPVDYCCRLMVCSIWSHLVERPRHHVIYNCCSSATNPVTYKIIMPVCMRTLAENPYDQIYARPRLQLSRTTFELRVQQLFKHYIPAYLIDIGAYVIRQRPRMVKVYNTIHQINERYAYFWTNEWKFHNSNSEALLSRLHPNDQEEFSYDMRRINWIDYWANVCLGIRKFVMKEDPADIPHARKQFTKYRAMRFTWNFCLVLVFSRAMYLAANYRFQWMRQLWFSLVSFLVKLMKASSLLKFF